MAPTINVLIDLPPEAPYHRATVEAVEHAVASPDRASASRGDAEVRVVPTATIDPGFIDDPGDGLVIGPGSPYDRPDRAEAVITTARRLGIPLVGT